MRGCPSLQHLDFSMVMTFRNFDSVLRLISRQLPGLQSLAIHGLEISSAAFVAFCTACRESLASLQMRCCDIESSALPAAFTLPKLRRLDLGGTFMLFDEINIAAQSLGAWLEARGPGLSEFSLAGVLLAGDEQNEEQILQAVAAAEALCQAKCKNAERLVAAFTAVSPSSRGGIPMPLDELRSAPRGQSWLDGPRLFERVRPTFGEAPRRICTGDPQGPWPGQAEASQAGGLEAPLSTERYSIEREWEHRDAQRCRQQ